MKFIPGTEPCSFYSFIFNICIYIWVFYHLPVKGCCSKGTELKQKVSLKRLLNSLCNGSACPPRRTQHKTGKASRTIKLHMHFCTRNEVTTLWRSTTHALLWYCSLGHHWMDAGDRYSTRRAGHVSLHPDNRNTAQPFTGTSELTQPVHYTRHMPVLPGPSATIRCKVAWDHS